MLYRSNNANSEKFKLVHESVYSLAEFLIMTGGHMVPSNGMVAQLFTKHSNPQDLQRIIQYFQIMHLMIPQNQDRHGFWPVDDTAKMNNLPNKLIGLL